MARRSLLLSVDHVVTRLSRLQDQAITSTPCLTSFYGRRFVYQDLLRSWHSFGRAACYCRLRNTVIVVDVINHRASLIISGNGKPPLFKCTLLSCLRCEARSITPTKAAVLRGPPYAVCTWVVSTWQSLQSDLHSSPPHLA